MYKDNSQLRMEDFIFPYGKLDPENDWVKLAALVPWEIAEERYAARFVNNGHPAHSARMALGALLIQRRLKLEASVPKAATGKQDDSDDGNDPPNSGTLILDATSLSASLASS
ncbi:MAG: hypothetical protein HFF72_10195 [Oscillospiraceae bacterium]|nr:hypothetical protein [Oscillospiraceae bacterium]